MIVVAFCRHNCTENVTALPQLFLEELGGLS